IPRAVQERLLHRRSSKRHRPEVHPSEACMAQSLFRNESPVEFFREQVEGAMQRQQVRTTEWTAYYLVNLLVGFISPRRPAGPATQMDEALGVRLTRALQAEGALQREELRRVGDCALFLAGFFGDSPNRRLVDVDYYIALGEQAYGRLSHDEADALADVFGEMASKFVPLVDVLTDISERAALTTNRDLLRVYERWLRTGSRRDSALLAERGVLGVPSRLIQ